MHYSGIKPFCIENGIGVRVSLFVSGCRNACKGCFQPETWNFCYGEVFTKEAEDEILSYLEPDYIQGLTLLGGDPLEEENQEVLAPFLKRVKERYPEKDVWAYTGYILEEDFVEGGKKHTAWTEDMLNNIDVLVDGPFVQEKKNLMLKFRGSENQRVIDMNATREKQEIVLLLE